MADYKTGYSITVAPLAVKDKVVVGVAGGEFGVRGFLDAYDAKLGQRAWRFSDGAWSRRARPQHLGRRELENGIGHHLADRLYDPESNRSTGAQVILARTGTVIAAPVTISTQIALLALDADTGKLKWYFQFTPHDTHDWDANEIPVMASAAIRGQERNVILFANRNAFYYVLDRSTGEFLSGRAFANQSWAKGPRRQGPGGAAAEHGAERRRHEGLRSLNGATNWQTPHTHPTRACST